MCVCFQMCFASFWLHLILPDFLSDFRHYLHFHFLLLILDIELNWLSPSSFSRVLSMFISCASASIAFHMIQASKLVSELDKDKCIWLFTISFLIMPWKWWDSVIGQYFLWLIYIGNQAPFWILTENFIYIIL